MVLKNGSNQLLLQVLLLIRCDYTRNVNELKNKPFSRGLLFYYIIVVNASHTIWHIVNV